MTVSRKSNNTEEDTDYELTEECYLGSKEVLQARSGYDPVPLDVLKQKAVEEKLPSGSQSY